MSTLQHTAFRGCRFLFEAAKSTTRSPKAVSSSASKKKAAATTSKSSTSAGKQGRSPSARPTGILKDPMNKREINCDHKLKTIFGGKDKVGFLEISKLLSAHFVKPN